MTNKQNYLARLQGVIEQLYKCGATHKRTAQVHTVFKGQTILRGEVEVYDLHGHARARHCYAWCVKEGNGEKAGQFVTLLEVPPVVSPQTALLASVILDAKKSEGATAIKKQPQ